jgi:hypothetical protein
MIAHCTQGGESIGQSIAGRPTSSKALCGG